MRASPHTWWTQAVQNRLIALVLAMMVVVPLVASALNSRVQGMSALAFQGLAIVLLATLLWNVRWDLRRERVSAFVRTGPNLPLMLLLGLAVLSCLLSPAKGYSIQETLRLGAGILLYFVVAYQFRRSEHLSKLVDVLLFVGIGAAVLGFAHYASSGADYRVGGTFGDKQLLASFLMLLLPIVGVIALSEKAPGRQLVAQIGTVVMAAALLLTQTRSGWLGAAAGLATLGGLTFLSTRSSRGSSLSMRKHELVLPLMLMVVSLGLFVAFWPQQSMLLERAGSIRSLSASDSLAARQLSFDAALQMLRERPLTGFGVGMFPVLQHRYTGLGNSLAESGMRPYLNEQAHSYWLQLAAELGIPGLLLMVSTLALFFVGGLRRLRGMDAGIRRTLLMGSLASMAGFAVDAIASPSWQYSQTSMFMWLVLGLGMGCLRSPARVREEAPAAVAVRPRLARPSAVLASLLLASLLPTVLFAQDGAYKVDLVDVSPNPAATVVKGGIAVRLTLQATFLLSDGSTVTEDVTLDPNTTYVLDSGLGYLTGPNSSVYQTRPRMPETAQITGTHTFNGESQSTTFNITVLR
jgi:putative inorganic carbon (HCO3(-)) transporter